MAKLIEDKTKNSVKVNTSDKKIIASGLTILLLVFGIMGGWMAYAPLNSAAVAVGKVAVESNKKTIQHLEGGIVEKIYVKDGDSVKKGDLLIELNSVRIKSQLEVLDTDYRETKVLEERLIAERDDAKKIVFSDEVNALKDEVKTAIKGQIGVFETRKKLRQSEKDIMFKRAKQLSKQIDGIKSLIKSRQERIISIDEEIKEWERLYKEQLTDKIKLRELKREEVAIEGEIASQQSEIAKLEVQITENESQILVQERSFKEEVLSKLQEVQLKLADIRARKKAFIDQLERSKIISPVDGTVVGLEVHTIGGVIAPGREIMTVVPKSKDLIVDAQMQITDIDKVHVGLKADVRFSAFKLQMVHVIEGEVMHVSADSFVDQQSGAPYYEVKVKVTNEGMKYLKENKFFLLPGMPAEVMIKTGERTVLSYLINPFMNMMERAFKED